MTRPKKSPGVLTLFLGRGGRLAISAEPDGGNLPSDLGPWVSIGHPEALDDKVMEALEPPAYAFIRRVDDGPEDVHESLLMRTLH